MEIPGGWLLVYLIGSVPVICFYSMGLTGWFFEYPLGLFFAILAVLSVPLWLLVFKVPSAPTWNIAGLWVGAGLITLRIMSGIVFADKTVLLKPAGFTLAAIVVGAVTWAVIWTIYFRASERVATSFG